MKTTRTQQYTLTSGLDCHGRHDTLAAATRAALALGGRQWLDLCCWAPDGSLAFVVIDSELIRPGFTLAVAEEPLSAADLQLVDLDSI